MELEELTKNELIKLIKSYDRYIQDIVDGEEYLCSRYPVCIDEYLNNDFDKLEEDDGELEMAYNDNLINMISIIYS